MQSARLPLPQTEISPPASLFQVRNIHIAGKRTSIRLEQLFWQPIDDLCTREGISVNELCNLVHSARGHHGLTTALRMVTLFYFHALSQRLEHSLNYLAPYTPLAQKDAGEGAHTTPSPPLPDALSRLSLAP
jgi:predicted DNA-binding ribbon-helix-helix protein